MQAEVAEDLRTIFNAPDRATAEAYLAKTVVKYEKSAPRLSVWMAANVPEGLTVFSFPVSIVEENVRRIAKLKCPLFVNEKVH